MMHGLLGIPELLVIAVILLGVFGSALGKRGMRISGPTLVLKVFQVNPQPTSGRYIEISGRAEGFVAFVLSWIGLDAESRLEVTDTKVSFASASLSGRIEQVVPMNQIASSSCGYIQSMTAFIAAAIFGVLAVAAIIFGSGSNATAGFFFCVVVAGVCAAVYYYSKKMMISIETSGGSVFGLVFKRGLAGQQSVEFAKVQQAIDVLNQLVLREAIKSATSYATA